MNKYLIHYKLAAIRDQNRDYSTLREAIEELMPGCHHIPESMWVGTSLHTLPDLKLKLWIALSKDAGDSLMIFELTGKVVAQGLPEEANKWLNSNFDFLSGSSTSNPTPQV